MQDMSSSKANSEIRVRIAPSPTGYPHIGTIYQALFNFAFAKKNKGKFIVRIEDTDRTRFVEDAEEKIYSALDHFGLSEDESPRKEGEHGPYRQSERLEIYHKYAQELVEKGGAYFAFYPKEENSVQYKVANPSTVQEMLEIEDWVLRLKVPIDAKIVVRDEIRGNIEFDSNEVTEQVLLKSDGFPTYHLAVVVDDHLMRITDAVRGEEWITSFPKHKLIYDYLGWEMPRFYHTPVLRNPDRSKLSKRQGHTNVSWYQENGYLKEAILNFLALLGWSHPEEKEIFSLDEFINLMHLKDIKPVGPIFDINKLEWMNGEYIRNMDSKELAKRIVDFYDDLSEEDLQDQRFVKFIELVKTRIKTLKEYEEYKMFYHVKAQEKVEVNENVSVNIQPESQDIKVKINYPRIQTEVLEMVKDLIKNLSSLDEWKKEKIHEVIKTNLDKHNLRFPDLYIALSGKKFGPPLADTFEIIGKEKTLDLLKS